MNKIKLGEIFEIETPKGKVYLHYIYKDKNKIDLVRVLQGAFLETPSNFEQLVKSKERFMVFFALSGANKLKIVRKVGFYSAEEFEKPQYMRTKHIVGSDIRGWDIVNTETLYRKFVKELSPDQIQLSPWGIWNDTLLIQRLTEGWTLENWK